ncbi:SLAP domain-containing protein [Effusibacillus dendaii]|uniref:Lipoprotein n=1 Tax=Effusibacillus dendaii TaxID=2743772 RepID=A0A7I8D8Z2_9BACL|nr:SLAP domain-containing protein [Effusibacillus dendaii]BCJ86618.1 hypothetical protein skT53_16030 [Effusibacillus dendaii]
MFLIRYGVSLMFGILVLMGCSSPNDSAPAPNSSIVKISPQTDGSNGLANLTIEDHAMAAEREELLNRRQALLAQGGKWVEPRLVIPEQQKNLWPPELVKEYEEALQIYPPIIEGDVDVTVVYADKQADGAIRVFGMIRNGIPNQTLTAGVLKRITVTLQDQAGSPIASGPFDLSDKDIGQLKPGDARPIRFDFPNEAVFMKNYDLVTNGFTVKVERN